MLEKQTTQQNCRVRGQAGERGLRMVSGETTIPALTSNDESTIYITVAYKIFNNVCGTQPVCCPQMLKCVSYDELFREAQSFVRWSVLCIIYLGFGHFESEMESGVLCLMIKISSTIWDIRMRDSGSNQRSPRSEEAQKYKVGRLAEADGLIASAVFNFQSKLSQELGNEAFGKHEYQLAEQMYTEAIRCDDLNSRIRINRAIVLMQLEKYDLALADALEAVRLQPTYPNGYLRASEALVHLYRLDEAQQFLDKAKFFGGSPEEVEQLKERLLSVRVSMKKVPQLVKLNETRRNVQKLLDWLKDGGATFQKIQVHSETPNNRSVIATTKINKKQILLFIPLSKMITIELAQKCHTVQLLGNRIIELCSPKHCTLAIFLLHEKHSQNSPFKQYIQVLPKEHSSFPLYYTNKELEELRGSYFLEQLQQKRHDIQKDYEAIVQADPTFSRFKIQQFYWARMTVCSRIFGITIQGNKTDALVPLADMLNHRVPKQTIWNYCDEREGFIIESIVPIEKSCEIFDSYGKKCNSRFLLNYGFIHPKNESNEVTVRLDLQDTSLPCQSKFELLSQDVSLYLSRISRNFESKQVEEFISVARFAAIDCQHELNLLKEESRSAFEQEKFKITSTPFLSFQLELKMWKILLTVFERQIAAYPTTLNEDKKLLTQSTELSLNVRNCILLRKGEKELLHYFQKICNKMCQLFSKDLGDFMRSVRRNLGKDYTNYLNMVIASLDQQLPF